MRLGLAFVAAALTWMSAATLQAADDAELIPEGVLDPPSAAAPFAESGDAAARPMPSPFRHKLFLEDALTVSGRDDVVVPYPSPAPPRWHDRISFDAVLQGNAGPTLTLTLSDRLNVVSQEGQALASRQTLRNDLREVYLAWQPSAAVAFEGGRINVRNGAALGWSPTDFFKSRTLVGQATLDPSAMRQNRLGTLMVRGQAIGSRGSVSLAFAPKVTSPSPIVGDDALGVDPQLAATNAAPRVLGTLNLDLFDLSAQLLVSYEPARAKLGVNLSRPVGRSVIVYGDWAGGPEPNLIARALALGKRTGTLPEAAPIVPPTATSTAFRHDLATGFSWAVATTFTLNLEYHFHQSGFGRDDWRRWFDLGGAPEATDGLTRQLWYLRAYANAEQEPLTRHQGFARVSWPRALVSDLELSALAFVNLVDGSVLAETAASYYLSRRWTASVFLSGNLGAARSEHGSFPQRKSSILQLTLYL